VLAGQKTALQTMLSEQRGYVAAAQVRVTALEAEQAHSLKLQKVKATATTIRHKRTELHAGITALSGLLGTELPRLTALFDDWRQRRSFQEQAEALGAPPVQMPSEPAEQAEARASAADSLFAELADLGVDVEALRLSVFANEYGMTHVHDLPDRLPSEPGGLTLYSPAVERMQVPVIAAELLVRFMELSAQDASKMGEGRAV